MGLAQVGFVPVVELPYAKYLDCGADMFQESLITHWLSDGTQKNGMMYRLQGPTLSLSLCTRASLFDYHYQLPHLTDKGVFGGNFHLPFVSSPGLGRNVPFKWQQLRQGHALRLSAGTGRTSNHDCRLHCPSKHASPA